MDNVIKFLMFVGTLYGTYHSARRHGGWVTNSSASPDVVGHGGNPGTPGSPLQRAARLASCPECRPGGPASWAIRR